MKFSLVIPTFNRSDSLKEVLPSLAHQNFPSEEYEILVCDAGSTDGTLALIEELSIPNLRVLVGEDRGRAGARNRGVRQAGGEIILFTDADIIADPNLVYQHQQAHQRFPGDAVVGCEIQVDTLDQYRRYREYPARHARHRPDRGTLPWHYFLTGNASVQRKTLLEVGMFDEDFTGYGHEDLELGYRLLQAGLSIRYNPDAINYHWHPVPFPEQCDKMHLAGRSTVRFYQKHRDWKIPLVMGWNPLSLSVHSLIRACPVLYRWLWNLADRLHLAREIVLQYHYVSGIKTAL